MSEDVIVTLNAGSSSLRCAIFDRDGTRPRARLRLSLRGLPDKMIWQRHDPRTGKIEEHALDPPESPDSAQQTARTEMMQRLLAEVPADSIAAVSHRVVHGGDSYGDPVEVTGTVLADLEKLSPLAPSHQPHNLAAISAVAEKLPGARQIACFDTAFHRTLPNNDRLFALPLDLIRQGVRRYGFHGLSFQHVTEELARTEPKLAAGRVVLAHLGHGVSLCALRDGQSIATTMGMTALDGVPMGRRPGALDPGILLYLIEQKGMDPANLREMLYERSGLLGLSGISSEMGDLIQSDAEDARTAVAFFVYRCQREIGSLAAALGGLDGLVLTGGMGEHVPEIRARICADLGWLGVEMDEDRNESGKTRLSPDAARVVTLMIPADEESVLAQGAETALSAANTPDPDLSRTSRQTVFSNRL